MKILYTFYSVFHLIIDTLGEAIAEGTEFLRSACDVLFRDLHSYNKDLTPSERDRLLHLWKTTLSDENSEFCYEPRRPIHMNLRTDCEDSGAICVFDVCLKDGDDKAGLRREMIHFLTNRGLTHSGVKVRIHEHKLVTYVDLLAGETQLNGSAINQRISIILDMLDKLFNCNRWNDYLANEFREAIVNPQAV